VIEFPTLGHLADHFLRETAGELVIVREAIQPGLDAASALIEKEAKAEFGTYQQGIGPFGDWPELADATKEDRVRQGYPENEPLLRSGELRDSIEREVDHFEATVGSKSEIMLYQELGTQRIPPRPVLGIALQRCWPQIQALIGKAAAAGFCGGGPINRPGYEL
jgi:hypothetical protein